MEFFPELDNLVGRVQRGEESGARVIEHLYDALESVMTLLPKAGAVPTLAQRMALAWFRARRECESSDAIFESVRSQMSSLELLFLNRLHALGLPDESAPERFHRDMKAHIKALDDYFFEDVLMALDNLTDGEIESFIGKRPLDEPLLPMSQKTARI